MIFRDLEDLPNLECLVGNKSDMASSIASTTSLVEHPAWQQRSTRPSAPSVTLRLALWSSWAGQRARCCPPVWRTPPRCPSTFSSGVIPDVSSLTTVVGDRSASTLAQERRDGRVPVPHAAWGKGDVGNQLSSVTSISRLQGWQNVQSSALDARRLPGVGSAQAGRIGLRLSAESKSTSS